MPCCGSSPNSSMENTAKGAYAVIDCKDPEIILIGTGSEVSVCVEAAKSLGDKCKVVSMPCWELFRDQPASYKDSNMALDARGCVSYASLLLLLCNLVRSFSARYHRSNSLALICFMHACFEDAILPKNG